MISAGTGIIAVNIEGMACSRVVVIGAINDGASSSQFVLDEVTPLGVTVVGISQVIGLEQELGILVILEELDSPQNIFTQSPAATDGIVHLLGLADVAHQVGHSRSLQGGIGARVVVQHVVPVKCCGRQFGQDHGIGRQHVGGHGRRLLLGILPVMKDHRQRGCRAPRVAGIGTEDGALVPIGCILAPIGGQERIDRLCRTCRHSHLDCGVVKEKFYLPLVAVQPIPHGSRQRRHFLNGTVAIGKNGLCAVITCNDNKSIRTTEHIIGRNISTQGTLSGKLQLQ